MIIIVGMEKRVRGILIAFLFMIALSGCGKEKIPEETTIAIDEEGRVVYTIVEEFQDEEYDAQEFKKSLEESIKNYNDKAGKEKADLHRFEAKDGKLKVMLKYDSPEDFSALNDASSDFYYFYGTVADAETKGVIPEVMLYKDGNSANVGVNGTGIRKYPDRHFMVIMESANVKLPNPILFCTENVELKEDGEARVNIEEIGGKAYILTE